MSLKKKWYSSLDKAKKAKVEAKQTAKEEPFKLQVNDGISYQKKLTQDVNLHVQQAAAQQRLCNQKIAEAKANVAAGKSHADSRQCIVIDFSQNGELPYFGEN